MKKVGTEQFCREKLINIRKKSIHVSDINNFLKEVKWQKKSI